MPFSTLLTLILCNVIWSAHPVMSKYLLEGFSPQQAACLRYSSALVSYLLAALALRLLGSWPPGRRSRKRAEIVLVPRGARETWLVLALGCSAFCVSPLLQLTGLVTSRALDNALIVAMEPLITVLMAWLLLRERPMRHHLACFGVALGGFALLTGPTGSAGMTGAHWLGNLLILLSLFGEGLYSVLGRKLLVHHSPSAVFGAAIAVGAGSLTLVTVLSSGLPGWAQITHMSAHSALGLLWLGPLGTALSYLYWMSALKTAPVASVVLTLFIQPVLGPVWGALFLGERLNAMQGLGSGLILIAVFGQAWGAVRVVRAT